ncbi:MAG: alpha/beta fold hydrolase [Muribaculaceae bacterium]
MNLTSKSVMVSLLALATVSSCGTANDETIIEKPNLTVENGQFTPEILEGLGRVTGITVSPDGTKILYGITYENIELNKGNRELWIMNADGSNAVRLTKTASSEQNETFIDEGKKIAFIAREGEKMQLFTMNVDGSSRKCVSEIENGVDGFVFSPDEKKVAFISTVKYGETTVDKHPDLPKANARIIDDLMYRHWDEWVKEIPHTFVADFNGSELLNVKDLLEGEQFEAPMKPFGSIESIAWTADSKGIVYVSRKKTGLEYSISTNSDLYKYDVETGKIVNLTEGMMGYDTNPVFSHDGKKLAWLSMEHDGCESDKNRIFVLDMESGEKIDLTAEWDYSVDAIAWGDDDKDIYFVAPFQGTIPMFKINVASHAVDTIAAGECDYAAVVPAGDVIYTLRHSFNEPNEIYAVKQGAEPTKLTNVNDELLSQLKPIKVEKRLVPTTDGKLMTTWVLYPPEFDASKKYPAILYCQGGPQSPVSQFWSYRWNLRLMASNGYIVIAPNRRGLPGFGTEWNAQISGDYGGQNMKDYLSAVDYMKQEPYVDSSHIGAVGASYGGFSVYWLAGHHEGRFAAFIAHAGIFNIESQYLETEEMWFANWDMGGAFWDKDNATAQRTFANSPHKFVQNWDTPIMITVGELDYRIVFTQGMMAFNAAKLRGIPSHLVTFPDENHWILKPQNALLWQREFFSWLDKWLKPQDAKQTAE